MLASTAVEASIGIHPHERENKQTIWLTIDAGVLEEGATPEAIVDVVCYEDICKLATALATDGHIDLVETLASVSTKSICPSVAKAVASLHISS